MNLKKVIPLDASERRTSKVTLSWLVEVFRGTGQSSKILFWNHTLKSIIQDFLLLQPNINENLEVAIEFSIQFPC